MHPEAKPSFPRVFCTSILRLEGSFLQSCLERLSHLNHLITFSIPPGLFFTTRQGSGPFNTASETPKTMNSWLRSFSLSVATGIPFTHGSVNRFSNCSSNTTKSSMNDTQVSKNIEQPMCHRAFILHQKAAHKCYRPEGESMHHHILWLLFPMGTVAQYCNSA
eukprot:300071-Amphidinium_carterae.1